MSFGLANDFTGTSWQDAPSRFNGYTTTSDGRKIRRDGRYQYVYDKNGNLISKTPLNFTNTGGSYSNSIAGASPSSGAVKTGSFQPSGNKTWVGANNQKVTSTPAPTGPKSWAGANAASSGQSVSSASVPTSSGSSGNSGNMANNGNSLTGGGQTTSGGGSGTGSIAPVAPTPAAPMTGWFNGIDPTMAASVMANPQQLANVLMWQQGLDPLGRNSAGANILAPWAAVAPTLWDIAAYANLPAGGQPNMNIQDQVDWVGNFVGGGGPGPGQAGNRTVPNANALFQQLGGALGNAENPFFQTYYTGDPAAQASSMADLVGAITTTGSSFNQANIANAMLNYATNRWMQQLMQSPENAAPLAQVFLNAMGINANAGTIPGLGSGNNSIGG